MSQATSTADLAPRGTTAPQAGTRGLVRVLRPLLMIGGIAVVAIGGVYYWLQGGRYLGIEDSYVRADKLALSTDVSGIVQDIPVHEGQLVKKGDVLFRLDPRRFQIALDGAKANLAQTVLTLNAAKLDYQRMVKSSDALGSQVQSDQVNSDRLGALVRSGGVTRQAYDDARFKLAADQQNMDASRVGAQVQLAKLAGDADIDATKTPAYQQAQAQIDEAQRQLDRSVVHAPFDGIVTDVNSLQPGMYLAASTAAFGLVSTENVWIEANPKETELTFVKLGDTVELGIDTYPGVAWTGTVESISPVSGSEFSVLPAQNSSGNWVKVVQRIPLRIKVERKPDQPMLRAGMSAEVSIDTGHTRKLSDLF